MTITIYSKSNCVACDSTYRKLDKHGVPYSVVNIEEDAEALAFARGLDPSYSAAPIVHVQFADGTDKHWSGYRDEAINALVQKGAA